MSLTPRVGLLVHVVQVHLSVPRVLLPIQLPFMPAARCKRPRPIVGGVAPPPLVAARLLFSVNLLLLAPFLLDLQSADPI